MRSRKPKIRSLVKWYLDDDPDDAFDASDLLPTPTQTGAGGWLTWMADALRAAGLKVIEYDGWQTRARSSGAYAAGKPLCVMWHHTASGASADGIDDVDYIAVGSADAPLSNLYIDRQGYVWVIAAGATNTNGKGKSMEFSRGVVPADSMNTHAVGIECGNNGVGETWPQAQVDALFAASNCINANCGNQPTDVGTHQFYAPDRKIDPATADAVQGPWRPSACTSSGTWSLEAVRAECEARGGLHIPPVTPPQPAPGPGPGPGPTPTEDDDMRLACFLDDAGTIWVGNGLQRHGIPNMDVFSNYVVLSVTGSGSPMYSANGVLVRALEDVGYGGPDLINALGVPI